ncbi:MAG TPA: ABC transporter substrate-binding protein [Stellaceae bacterium]|nr:ABC transporter substrate-binding protein [Stellaceae bacterium]
MRRRDLFILAAGTALRPRSGAAQQAKVPTIGVLLVQSPGSEQFWRGLKDALRALGYVEGQNIRFEFRSDEGKQDRLPELAAELVRLRVDVIVTWFTPAAHAAKEATQTIPIVMGSAAAVETGLVASLARPGGNVTGMSDMGPELDGKMVELIREMVPSVRRIAALANASDPFSKPFLEKIELAGHATETTIDPVGLHGPDELTAGFAALRKERPDAVIVQPSLGLERPAALAIQNRLPAAEHFREFAEAGGLLSYAALHADLDRRVAVFVDKILKGAKPADLPVERPTRFELVVNLKTAKALGLTIPHSFLLRADKVIE